MPEAGCSGYLAKPIDQDLLLVATLAVAADDAGRNVGADASQHRRADSRQLPPLPRSRQILRSRSHATAAARQAGFDACPWTTRTSARSSSSSSSGLQRTTRRHARCAWPPKTSRNWPAWLIGSKGRAAPPGFATLREPAEQLEQLARATSRPASRPRCERLEQLAVGSSRVTAAPQPSVVGGRA